MEVFEPTNSMTPVGEQRRRRGRPCALERQNNEILQARFSSLISQSQLDFNSDFAKLNIIPFITRRQRRARANDRERFRMQTLNEALDVLKSHLPLEYLIPSRDSESGESARKTHERACHIKLTKIDTLKLAAKYIRILTEMLGENECRPEIDSTQWSWPYTPNESSSAESLSPCLGYFPPIANDSNGPRFILNDQQMAFSMASSQYASQYNNGSHFNGQ